MKDEILSRETLGEMQNARFGGCDVGDGFHPDDGTQWASAEDVVRRRRSALVHMEYPM